VEGVSGGGVVTTLEKTQRNTC